jgi:hemerythrin-like domain-containing protein
MDPSFCAEWAVAIYGAVRDNGPAMNDHQHDRHSCGCTCAGAHPIDVLSQEHQTILAVLGVMDAHVQTLRSGAPVRADFWQPALDFLEHFADGCHHAKEEQLLFAELEKSDFPGIRGPTECMRHEHELGRELWQRMVRALQVEDGPSLAAAASAYVALLREHIEKEEEVLFPMARSLLDRTVMQRLSKGFAKVEHLDVGEGEHARYEELACSLVAVHGQPD